MLLTVCLYCFSAVVCIAIEAPVFAGVICADINACHAAAFRPLVFILLDLELTMPKPFQPVLINAASMWDLKAVELYRFRTGINENTIVMCDL